MSLGGKARAAGKHWDSKESPGEALKPLVEKPDFSEIKWTSREQTGGHGCAPIYGSTQEKYEGQ